MTKAESIIISQATLHSKIRSTRELAKRSGLPYTTLRDKMARPGNIRMSDIAALDPYCKFSAESILTLASIAKKGDHK